MKTATVDRPTIPSEMGRREAESITKAIQNNFDSLGLMLLQARDEKAYKALGYRSFEGYCKNEFGKSKSSAYRSIEDAQVRAQLEAEISKKYDKPISLSISSACLKPLKELPDISKKLEAIDYANKIAEEEGRKPEKKDLEIAAFKIGGHRPDDFKKAIQSLGFTQGTAVEVIANSGRDRGFVKRVDKRGKIYVELHNGGVTSIAYDSSQLRILGDTEKPVIPTNDNTVNKGDKVKIFARGLEGKTGEIYTWKMGKHAMVIVDGRSAPIDIPYAELELIQETKAITVEVKQDNQWQDFNWIDGENHYYYFARENKIFNTSWPNNLTISPDIHSESPAKYLGDWMKKFAAGVAKSLSNCDIEVLQAENQKLREQLAEAEYVIEELVRTKPAESLADTAESLTSTAVKIINQREDHPQLAEATDSAMDYYYAEDDEAKIFYTKALGLSFSMTIEELLSGKKTQTRRMWNEGYASHFIRYFEEKIAIPALNKGRYRGGHELGHIRLTQRPYQQLLSEMTTQDLLEEGGMVETTQEFIDRFFEEQDKLVWVLHFEFQRPKNTAKNPTPGDTATPTDFLIENTDKNPTPGDTAAHTDSSAENTAGNLSLDSNPETESFPPALLTAITEQENKLREIIKTKKYEEQPNGKKLSRKEAAAISADRLQKHEASLQQLEDFRKVRIGQYVRKRLYPEMRGQIVKLEMSPGGMPLVWVDWNVAEVWEKKTENLPLKSITVEI